MPRPTTALSIAAAVDALAADARCPLTLARLVEAGLGDLPPPAGGHTLVRWQALAAVAAHDLSLAKLYEGHTDALAILRELGHPLPMAGSRWGTWCAEPAAARLEVLPARRTADVPAGAVRLRGRKAWCSGAAQLTHALVSGWNPAGQPVLAALALDQPGVHLTREGWHAVGMADTASVDVRFEDALATAVGSPGDYTGRPGFWHGAAGIAACWWGGAAGIARRAFALAPPAAAADPHSQAHLGALDAALAPVAALLRQTASALDAWPAACARAEALRLRAAAEHAADTVLHHAGRMLGAAAFCRDPGFARAAADLPVFLRQSHAERDLAALGQLALQPQAAPDGTGPRGNSRSACLPGWVL